MTCIIVEDQPPAQRILQKYIEDMGFLVLKGTFSDAVQVMTFLKKESVDIIFLDIHLPKLSGMDFLKTITNPPNIILTTAFSEYALESYEYNVVDYLLKPFSFQRFAKAVSKVQKQERESANEHEKSRSTSQKVEIYIKSGFEHIKIDVANIQHITSDSDYTEIITSNKKYLSNESLRYWLETLPKNQFFRIHKSYIINLKKIERITGNRVYLSEGGQLPIGRAYKESFMKMIL
ncbi:MAG: LytTR family DNA-binding domain-containing protein [Bacteroidota bacterium]